MTNDTSYVFGLNSIMRIFLKHQLHWRVVFTNLLNFRLSLIIYGVVAVVAALIIISMKLSLPLFTLKSYG